MLSPTVAAAQEPASFFQAPAAGSYHVKPQGDWDNCHHILFCNEQKVGDFKKLNPMQFRSYFDRMRAPDVGARSAEMRTKRADGTEEVTRVIPSWRLEPVIGSTEMPSAEELKVRRSPLAAHTGGGGSPPSGNRGKLQGGIGGGSKSSSSPTLSSTDRRIPIAGSPGRLVQAERRETGWVAKHALVFKNEEVSRLDRSYFDRFREPDCMLGNAAEGQKVRGSVRAWSLEQDGNPKEMAAKVVASGDKRCLPDGKWNDRHQLMFYNSIHPNARSYFERWREPHHHAGPKHVLKMTDPSELDGPAHQDPTCAAERRQRTKLKDEERLIVKWTLNSSVTPKDLSAVQEGLRRSNSDPTSRAAKRKESRREAWFSSHGIVF